MAKGTHDRGQVIRVSREVHTALAKKRTAFRSWDALMRCLLGLPARVGTHPDLHEAWLVPGSARWFARRAEARGESVRLAAKRGSENPDSPIKMREVL